MPAGRRARGGRCAPAGRCARGPVRARAGAREEAGARQRADARRRAGGRAMKLPGLDGPIRRLRARADTRAIDARLRELVPALDARLRRPAILDIAGRVAADLGAAAPAPLTLAGALVRVVSALLQDLAARKAEIEETVIAYQSAADPAEKRRVLEAFLRATVPQRLRARADIAATARWLDLEAAQERGTARIADRVDRLEIAYRSIARLAASLPPDEARVLASRGRLVEIALRSAAPEMHAAVRLVALKALERTLAAVPSCGATRPPRRRSARLRARVGARRRRDPVGANRRARAGRRRRAVRPPIARPRAPRPSRRQGRHDPPPQRPPRAHAIGRSRAPGSGAARRGLRLLRLAAPTIRASTSARSWRAPSRPSRPSTTSPPSS